MLEKLDVGAGLGFLFDMDGVIIESTAVHTRVWEIYLARVGMAADGMMARMLGKRNDQIVREIFGAGLPEREVERHGADKEQLYREMMGPVLEEHLVRGVREFVRASRSAGVPCALTTNAEPLNVDFVLRGAGLADCFDTIVDGHQVAKPKPDPEVFLTAAGRLKLASANCVVFEDSPGGIQAARSAGCRVVGLLTTLAEAPLADLAIPDFLDRRLTAWLSDLKAR